MKKRELIFLFAIMFCSLVSAEIIFTEPIGKIYNLGEEMQIPVLVKTLNETSLFQMDLICNDAVVNFHRVIISSGREEKIVLPLKKGIIGDKKGMCKIRATLDGESKSSEEFEISDALIVSSSIYQTTLNPEEKISITGEVTRKNLQKSNGFIKAEIISDEAVFKEAAITDGKFEIELQLPESIGAGNYILRLSAYEKDGNGATTNHGANEHSIKINQVPKNLELVIENREVLPEELIKIKPILHDQTGELINSVVYFTMKNSKDKVVEQREINSGESFEYLIPRGELPSMWKIVVESDELKSEKTFSILEKESADIKIINRTIYAENTGNVLYNKTTLVKLDNESLNLHIKLKVGESKKYVLKAPDGEYNVQLFSDENEITEIMTLTGNAVEISEVFDRKSINIYLWVALIFTLVIFMFISWNKVYKKSFLGKMKFGNKEKREKEIPVIGENNSNKANVAEVSMTIKGEKQDASFVCVKIKNLGESKSKRGSAFETISKMKEIGEGKKAVVYEDNDYLFFILAPAKTRTFKNEQTALELAQKIQEIIIDHNRRFNEKINYGISLENGTLVGKIENGVFRFMSMGPGIISAKKIATVADEKILLSEKLNDIFRVNAKTEREPVEGMNVFRLVSVKKENEEARKFISRFMERQKSGGFTFSD